MTIISGETAAFWSGIKLINKLRGHFVTYSNMGEDTTWRRTII